MSQVHTYVKGAVVRVSGVFKDISGTEIDPSAIFFSYKNPAGTTISYTYGTDLQLVKDSTGNYHVDIDADSSGAWHWRFYSTGTGKAADEGTFKISRSLIS